jgi:hypothetical protein
VFYLYADGAFYRSDDGGRSFSKRAEMPGDSGRIYVEAEPDLEGTVWVDLEHQGLFVSSDGGNSFAKIETVKSARLFGLGQGRVSGGRPALYIYGDTGTGESRLYMSDNLGKSWYDITDPSQMMGAEPAIMRGDMQKFGQVYLGTAGRGLFVGTLRASPTQKKQP